MELGSGGAGKKRCAEYKVWQEFSQAYSTW